MKILTPGHKYQLSGFDDPKNTQDLQFIEKISKREHLGTDARDGLGLEELVTINDGTSNEEVLEMLIDRMYYLQDKFSCRENAIVITKLEEALMWLCKRTADRKKRGVEGKNKK